MTPEADDARRSPQDAAMHGARALLSADRLRSR
jgi:hypothetical protein